MTTGFIMPCWYSCGERTGHLAATHGVKVEEVPVMGLTLHPNVWWQGFWAGWNNGMCEVFDAVRGKDEPKDA